MNEQSLYGINSKCHLDVITCRKSPFSNKRSEVVLIYLVYALFFLPPALSELWKCEWLPLRKPLRMNKAKEKGRGRYLLSKLLKIGISCSIKLRQSSLPLLTFLFGVSKVNVGFPKLGSLFNLTFHCVLLLSNFNLPYK